MPDSPIGHRKSPHARLAAAAALAVFVLASCTGSSDGASPAIATAAETATPAGTTAPTPPALPTVAPTTAVPPTVVPTTPAPSPTTVAGCTSGATAIPAGATSDEVVDVDGDGRPDTAWIITEPQGTVRVGVVTAAGGGAMRTWDSASPVARSLLVVDINPQSPPLFLADDGRTVELWAFVDCAIADVHNMQGEPYTFSLGFSDVGTGVGCAVVNGTEQLVGLDATNQTDTSVEWTSTVVEVTGTEARNGMISSGTFQIPADNAAIDLLHTVACRDKTIRDDGISA